MFITKIKLKKYFIEVIPYPPVGGVGIFAAKKGDH